MLWNVYMFPIDPSLIDYASSLWNLHYVGDVNFLQRIQRRTKVVTGLINISYYDKLRRLDLFLYQGPERILRANLILVWKILHHNCAIDPTELFFLGRVHLGAADWAPPFGCWAGDFGAWTIGRQVFF